MKRELQEMIGKLQQCTASNCVGNGILPIKNTRSVKHPMSRSLGSRFLPILSESSLNNFMNKNQNIMIIQKEKAWESLKLFIKLIAVPLLLVWLVTQITNISFSEIYNISWINIFCGLFFYHISLMLFAERMRATLKVFDIIISRTVALKIHLQSTCYFYLIPMSVGVEVARFLKIKKIYPGISFTKLGIAVFMDRLVALFAALFVSILLYRFLVMQPSFQVNIAENVLYIGSSLLIFFIILIYLCRLYIEKIQAVFVIFIKKWKMLLNSIAISIVMQFCMGYSIWLFGNGLGAEVAVVDIIFVNAFSIVAMVLPVSFVGVSLSEAAIMAMMYSLGYSTNVAILFTVIAYGMRLMAAIEGAILEIIEGGHDYFRIKQGAKFEQESRKNH